MRPIFFLPRLSVLFGVSVCFIVLLLLPACSGNRSESNSLKQNAEHGKTAALSVLFIGNSHSAPIPGLLQRLLNAKYPDIEVRIEAAGSYGFLIDHAKRPATLQQVKTHPWDIVVLQAQKYSTSGKYQYPYDGAIALANLAQEQGAQVIMYPEWSRRSEPNEFLRIEKIHNEIATEVGAIVAPVGTAWNQLLNESPKLKLYAADGNHASKLGSILNAAIFYRIVTGQEADLSGSLSVDGGVDNEALKTIQEFVASFSGWPDAPQWSPDSPGR